MEQILNESLSNLLQLDSGIGFIEAPIYQVPIPYVVQSLFTSTAAAHSQTRQVVYCVRQTERIQQIASILCPLQRTVLALYRTKDLLLTRTNSVDQAEIKHESQTWQTIDDVENSAQDDFAGSHQALQAAARNSDIIVCEFKHLFNPKCSILDHSETNGVVWIVEDAHDIQQFASSSRSVNLDRAVLMEALKNLKTLADLPDQRATQLDEFQAGVSDEFFGNFQPLNPEIPGNIRKQSHFIALMQRFAVFLTKNLSSGKIQSLPGFAYILDTKSHISTETLAYAWRRLQMILESANITKLDEFIPVTALCQFASICGSYSKNFVIINEAGVTQVACVNPFPLTLHYNWNILISPIIIDPTLGISHIEPVFSIKLQDNVAAILPMIVTKGSDQLTVSTNIESEAIQRNYGELLEEISDTIPDGIVVLFPNYEYLEQQIIKWNETLTFNRLLDNKLIFIEQQNSPYLENFRLACESGRGAFLFITQATPLPQHYCRWMVVLGIPQDLALDRYKKAKAIFDSEYLFHYAISRVSSAFSLTLQDSSDYTILLLVDTRYRNDRFRKKLPEWISKRLGDENSDLSVGNAVGVVNDFMKEAFYNRVRTN